MTAVFADTFYFSGARQHEGLGPREGDCILGDARGRDRDYRMGSDGTRGCPVRFLASARISTSLQRIESGSGNGDRSSLSLTV
jgi:hypothetical protein